MLTIAALAMAAASATASPALQSTASWWEKITVTIAGDGEAQACEYTSSLGGKATACEVEGGAANPEAMAASDEFTKITFERRFTPGADIPSTAGLHPGDTLLGGQMLALAIDEAGAVKGCKVVAKTGKASPDYGCAEAVAEKFEASARTTVDEPRQGYLTVLVYGHSEQAA